MSPPTAVRPSPAFQARPWRAWKGLRSVVAAIVAVAALVIVRPILNGPTFVHQITFDNPTAYDLDIMVTDAAHGGWMSVWTASRKDTTVAKEIYDIGDVWIFRYHAQG